MEQIRIFKHGNPVLSENITVYFDDPIEARAYLKELRKIWPRTVTQSRSLRK